jgi:peptidoglycan/LPS O-acetylase OafA/YrhL
MSSKRIPVVDGLRGIAILAVLTYHFALFGIKFGATLWERIYHNIAAIGWAGVDLFFVLSGFLITSILFQSRHNDNYYSAFYFRRAVRIFPLYYASLAILLLAVPVVMHHAMLRPGYQAFAWLYLLNWQMSIPFFPAVTQFLQHFWSLCIEEQFYLGWPFVVRALERRRLMMVCVVMIVFSLCLRVTFQRLQMDVTAYVLTFCRLDSLAIGALVGLALRDDGDWRIAEKIAPVLTALAATGLIVVMWLTGALSFGAFWMGTAGITLWGLFFGGCLVIALQAKAGSFVYRGCSSRFLRFFGKYSYALYICHQPLILALVSRGIDSDHLTLKLGSKLLAVLAVNTIALSIATVLAYLSWHLFEKHFLKLRDLPALRYGSDSTTDATSLSDPMLSLPR